MLHDLNGRNDKYSHSKKLRLTGSSFYLGKCLNICSAYICSSPVSTLMYVPWSEKIIPEIILSNESGFPFVPMLKSYTFKPRGPPLICYSPTAAAPHLDESRCLHRTWPVGE